MPLLLEVLADRRFASGDYDTSLLADYRPPDPTGAPRADAAPDDLMPVVAAALALHRRTPPKSIPAPGASDGGDGAWVREGRRDLGAWPR